MPATTTNISMTFNTAKNQDLTYGSATSNDKILLLVFSGSSVILSKKSVNYGGSADEIAITASTKYTAKFTAADASAIPNNATYKAYLVASDGLIMEEIFNGTFTVTGTTVAVATPSYPCQLKFVTETFEANGETEFEFPANSVLLMVKAYSSNGTPPSIDIVDKDDVVLVNDLATSEGAYVTSGFVGKVMGSRVTNVLDVESAAWGGSNVIIDFIYFVVDL